MPFTARASALTVLHRHVMGVQGGNNNTYCHDSPLNYLDWETCEEDASGFARFVRHLVHFRCTHENRAT